MLTTPARFFRYWLATHRASKPMPRRSVRDMDLTDWIIRAAIFGVLAAVVIGTFQNLYTAIKNRGKK